MTDTDEDRGQAPPVSAPALDGEQGSPGQVPRLLRDVPGVRALADGTTVGPADRQPDVPAVAKVDRPDGHGPETRARGRGFTIVAVGTVAAGALFLAAAIMLPSMTGGPQPSGSVAGVVGQPSQRPSASVEASAPAPTPTAAPVTAAPSESPRPESPPAVEGPGRLETSAAALRTWTDEFGEVRAQVIVTARNAGGSSVAVPGSQVTWRVLDDAGQVVTSGRFARAFPPIVLPGESVQLIDTVTATFAEEQELAALDVTLVSRPTSARSPSVVPLVVSKVTWEPNADGSVRVNGEVSNTADVTVHDVAVAVVLHDTAGEILAGAYDVSLGSIEPGASASFSTDYPGTPAIDVASISTAEGSAFGRR